MADTEDEMEELEDEEDDPTCAMCFNPVNVYPDAEWMKGEVCNVCIYDQRDELERAAIGLREAQKAYMLDRGNDLLGQRVADAATALDAVLAKIERG